jgi:hypothetical protein
MHKLEQEKNLYTHIYISREIYGYILIRVYTQFILENFFSM